MKIDIRISGRRGFLAGLAALAVLAGIYSAYSSLLPVWQIRYIGEEVKKDDALNKKYGGIFNMPDLNEQVRQKAYSESFIQASDNDSIFIFIDLVDSVAGLGINGVKIKESDIVGFKADRLFEALNNLEYIKVFSSPLRQKTGHATFEREPVVIKEAPSDTIEAMNNLLQPEIPKLQPAFVSMELSSNILLIINQVNTPEEQEGLSGLKFKALLAGKNTVQKLAGMLTWRKDLYIFKINITLPAEDIYEIYRAFPPGGKIVFRIP